MNIVAIRDMSQGNESVGEMWQETKIFDGNTPVIEVVKWAADHFGDPKFPRQYLAKKLTITWPHGEKIEAGATT